MRLVRLGQQPSRVAEDVRAALASLGRGSTVIGGIALVGARPAGDVPVEAVVLLPTGVLVVIGVDLPDPALRLEAPLSGPWKADGWPLVHGEEAVNPATEALDLAQDCERRIAELGGGPVGTIIAVGPYVETVEQPPGDLAGPVRVLHPSPTAMLAATVSLATARHPRSVDQARALIAALAPDTPELSDETLLGEGFVRFADDTPVPPVAGSSPAGHPAPVAPLAPGAASGSAPRPGPADATGSGVAAAFGPAAAAGPSAAAPSVPGAASGPAPSPVAGDGGVASGSVGGASESGTRGGDSVPAPPSGEPGGEGPVPAPRPVPSPAGASGSAASPGTPRPRIVSVPPPPPVIPSIRPIPAVAPRPSTEDEPDVFAEAPTESVEPPTEKIASPDRPGSYKAASETRSASIGPASSEVATSGSAADGDGATPSGTAHPAPAGAPAVRTASDAGASAASAPPSRPRPFPEPAASGSSHAHPPSPSPRAAPPDEPPPAGSGGAATSAAQPSRTGRWVPLGAIALLVVLVVAAVVVATSGGDSGEAAAPPATSSAPANNPAPASSAPPSSAAAPSLSFEPRASSADQRCASHAFGDVQGSLQQTSCSSVRRASYTAEVDGRAAAVTVAVVEFPDAGQATHFKEVADTPGGGGILDVATETGEWPGAAPQFDGAAYTSKLEGDGVRLVQAVWLPGPSTPDDPGLARAAAGALELSLPS
ncbi:hypothetical protein [Amycolatopsis jiangsuensis]|uniref:Uncharacterized protein n=1 Tax=Amycolatopsis jiangsuensis TaxID=1181879 RepID=A0A840IWC4_9PSEU|nr:hypothetical protein [Amycolatopsis jiangsuensis]MBB4685214.1 hypothetical protein [Amycolatopsis jiangsuensis]